MDIRVLRADDARAFRALRIRALRDHPEAFGRTPDEVDSADVLAERFGRAAGSETDFALGAFDAEGLVGIAGCHRELLAKHRHVATVWGVYVAPERRGAGLGRALMQAVMDRARKWPDLEYLWLEVTTTNVEARGLYVSCGFTTMAVKSRSLKLGSRYYDEELMVLDLGRSTCARP